MQPLTRNHRRDPAPSRWSYRMQRLWLTPMVRAAVRIGMPLLLIGGPTLLYLADADRRATLMGAVEGMKEDFQTRPEFMVSLVAVEGAGDDLAAAIRSRLNLNLPLSSFDLDLEAAQARIQTLDAVQATDLRIRAGGVLQVVIVERTPALVWRREGSTSSMHLATVWRRLPPAPTAPTCRWSPAKAPMPPPRRRWRSCRRHSRSSTGFAGWCGWVSGAGTSFSTAT
jgi:hypothetical protein